ncbi:hypothetical protein EMPG_13879 [Blastomyces silverae]|uniref:Uncharacterized protein n=1 Tax=Blastomyces silverae TaxID=2060906 RepID=A0A0H1BNI7_9EURO|nr:hypothetical protein EMPG_13879 [Blastomyces silverae]
MASQTIERLPPELLIHCCSYLKGSIVDIRNLRLTSKCLCSASSLFLFDTLTVRITTKSLSALEAVSNHPIFHMSVTTIRLSLCFYGDVQDQSTKVGLLSECDRRFRSIGLTITRIFNSTRRTAEEVEQFNRIQVRISDMKFALASLEMGVVEDRPPSLSFPPLRMIANTFDVCNARFVDQQAAIQRGTHLKRIGAAVSKFRRPLSFEIFGNIETLNEIDYRSCSMATTMEWLNSDEVCSDIILDVLESRGQYLAFGIEHGFARTFKGIFVQLSKHEIFPSRLTVELDAPKRLHFFQLSQVQHDAIRNIVQRAEHLSFAVRWWSKRNLEFGVVVIPAEQHYEEMKHLASLTTAFFNTESVRSVDLDIHDYSPPSDPPYISLHELLPDCEWPQLQALSLTGVPFHERELWKLVGRIRNSLEILDMDGLQILNGNWKNAFRILRGLDNLEEVSCRWPTGGEYGSGSYEDDLIFRFSENAVCQYLLKGHDAENPFG